MAGRKKEASLVSRIQRVFRIRFKNAKLLDSALFHPSYRNENACSILFDFDRLEFFGDSILNYVVCRHLYHHFPEANEGMLSRLRSILVSRKILSRLCRETGLYKMIQLNKSLQCQPLFTKTKIFADAFESFLAAIYLDQGLPKTEKFILKYFKPYFDAKRLFRLDPNPKSTLQEISQRQWQKLPVYTSEMTPLGMKCIVMIGRTKKAAAVARTRQESEEKAARLLIQKIRQTLVRRPKKSSSGRKLRNKF